MKTHRYLIVACTGLGAFCSPGATVPLTGGDAGQGLTVDAANFAKALNLGTGTAQVVQTATFNGTPNAGFTVTALPGFSGNFTGTLSFGPGEVSADDTAMTAIARNLLFSGSGFDVTVNSLTPGAAYKLELVQSVTASFGTREQAILVGGVWQENVLLNQSNSAKLTTLVATANGSGQIVIGIRPAAAFGGSGPYDGAVLSGVAVTAISNPDSDGDGLLDLWEYGYFPGDLTKLKALPADFDNDGATDKKEHDSVTNPTDPDSDDDTLTDGAELNRMVGGNPAPTNPNSRDTDGDGLYDDEETGTGTFVSASNTGSNPSLADSDGDTISDHIEVLRASNPNSIASVPTGPAPGPLVTLDATALTAGPLASWTNTGLLSRPFLAASATPPSVTELQGVKGVSMADLATSMKGPNAPSILTGNSSRTVEAWVYNPAAGNLETIVAWGRRNGPDGTLSAFSHGTNAAFGAFAGWGAGPDVGWGTIPPKTGRWAHVAYTYDSTSGVFKAYADGVLAREETIALNTWATDAAGNPLPIRLGAQTGNSGEILGESASLTLARLKVHDRPLTAAELQTGDSDQDGLPDFYEIFHGLNLASGADAPLDGDGDGVSSLVEFRLGTNPAWANPDTDTDGLFDEWELANFRDTLADPPETDAVILAKYTGSGPGTSDPDSDTFNNRDEFLGGSNPNDGASLPTDLDADQMADAWEIQKFGSVAPGPFDDNDDDGSYNLDEFLGNTADPSDWATDASNPVLESSQPDTDGNGIGDGWETMHFSGPGSTDLSGNPDGDGLNNAVEYSHLTDPSNSDTDGDGATDSEEVQRLPFPTLPRDPDSDNDGLADGIETGSGTYVSHRSSGSDPLDGDSDNDTFGDALEVARGSNPNNAGSTPGTFGLMAQWTMNETAGTDVPATPDSSFNGEFNNLLANPVTLAWQPGAGIGGALSTTDPTDRVEIPSMDLTYGFTVMGWIKPVGTQAVWARLITSRFQDGFLLGRDAGTNAWRFIVNNDFTLAGGAIVPDEWQHVCGTYDGTTARLYVNGVEVGSRPMLPPAVPVQPIHFGPEDGVDRSFTGLTDEFKVYSGALPATEVQSIHTAEAALLGTATPYEIWASSYGLDPDTNGAPAEDADSDDTTNQVEFTLGLVPNNGSSRFAATATGTPATGLTLTWPSKPGVSFQVRSGGSLDSFPTLEATVPGAAAPATVSSWSSAPFAPGSKKFYRLEFTP